MLFRLSSRYLIYDTANESSSLLMSSRSLFRSSDFGFNAPDWLSKASETHPPASFVEADLLQQRDEARLGTKRVVVVVNLDPGQIPVAILVGLFQQVERGRSVAEH